MSLFCGVRRRLEKLETLAAQLDINGKLGYLSGLAENDRTLDRRIEALSRRLDEVMGMLARHKIKDQRDPLKSARRANDRRGTRFSFRGMW